MKVGYLITGRLKSTRLPKKLLLDIKGRPVISHMLDRLKLAKKVDEIIICTSTEEQDKPLGEISRLNNVKCFFGDPDDVLSRLLSAAEKFELDYILNITADCPFVDPVYADNIVDKFVETDADLIRQFELPHGVFSYGIKVDSLRKIVDIKESSDTEVWGRYFTDTGLFNVVDLDVENQFHKRPGLRMTLDYPEDFDFFSRIFDELYTDEAVFSLDDILHFLDDNPDVIKINKDCGDKFRKRFYHQSEPKLKKVQTVSKALMIGCGSIGQRHLKNLKEIGIETIIALRSHQGHYKNLPAELDVIEVSSLDDAKKLQPDIAVISNPTSLHIESAKNVLPFVKGIMIEKPLSSSLDGTKELIELFENKRVVSFMGHNLMFHPVVKEIKSFSDSNDVGKIINIQVQVGQWLPDWHPYEDYKKAYYATKELGGGVALTLIHEIHLVLELAGLPLKVFGIVSESDELELEVDVQSDLMIKHKSGAVSQVHLDYLQRAAHRSGLIAFERGWISYDFSEMKVVGQTVNDESPVVKWMRKSYDYNLMYIEQMKQFVRYVEERRIKHEYDVTSSIESLKVVEALFKSNETSQAVDIERNERFSF